MLSLIKVRNYAVIDEVELELERGFSVMTGETGAGKSILVDALVMVPICPHTLSDRPLVLKLTSSIEVRVETDVGAPANVVCDGEPLGRIDSGEVLRIGLADETVTLLHPRDYNYYELLRSKLNWGRANRGDPPVRR